MNQTATLRDLVGDNPRFRILSPFARSGDEDFSAFSATQESTCMDALPVEGTEFKLIDVPPIADSGFTHFLDGSQKSRKVLADGFFPIYISHTSAAVLARQERQVQPPQPGLYFENYSLYVPAGSASVFGGFMAVQPIQASEDDTEMSVKDKISKEIGRKRESLEIQAAGAFLERSEGFLLIDGGIGRILEANLSATNIAGVVKTHSKQYFKSRASVELMCGMRAGQRSSVFKRESDMSQGAMVYSFYLKLRESVSESPMFGVIRVEMAPTPENVAKADEIASWILHERDPLSKPDPRHDRLLYPIRLVEMQLKARQPSDAAIAALIG